MARTPGKLTFAINRSLVGAGVVATDEEVAAAVAFAFAELKLVVEPGGAVALAALMTGKIDVAGKVAKIMYEAYGERLKPPDVMAKVVEDGRQGRKNKKGFYTYDGKKKEVDPTVYALLPHGKDRKHLDRQEMVERLTLQFLNEAFRCLGEGILRSPRDGDVGAIFGLGFPPFLGGPFRYAETLGVRNVLARTEHWHQKLGKRFEPAPLLIEYGKANKRFYS